jgi:Transposase DDE domain/Transposase domain (DUF772)
MTLGLAERQGNLLDDVERFCDESLDEGSIYVFLHRERERLFPDEAFADLFDERGRRSVPPSVVATVMVLQRLEGLSDREAVERYCFDNRWRYAAGVGGYDTGGPTSFVHTVLVDMRERLRNSENPDRIFEAALAAAKEAGLLGRRRVLDSTPLYDAVATMDTVTLIRSAIRGLLKVADLELATELRAAMRSGDDYATAGKPQIDWDDKEAREALVDTLARDAYSCLLVLEGEELDDAVAEAAELLATVTGQDIEHTDDETFRITRKVAKDRVISTVDPEARHGHKTAAHSYDGFRGHVAVDPDSEIITSTAVTPANSGDAVVAPDLISDLLEEEGEAAGEDAGQVERADEDESTAGEKDTTGSAVYGDMAYGTGEMHSLLEDAGIDSKLKTQTPTAPGGMFPKDRFDVDLNDATVTCPAGIKVTIRPHKDGGGTAYFADACASCPLRDKCTKAPSGRTITIHPYEEVLARARARQAESSWVENYRATRPKVERKLAHLMARRHGGRRARVRGAAKVAADFALLGAATNLARLAVLGVRTDLGGAWVAG